MARGTSWAEQLRARAKRRVSCAPRVGRPNTPAHARTTTTTTLRPHTTNGGATLRSDRPQVPHGLVDRVNRLQQNMFISAPTLSQIAGVAAFSDEADKELQSHLHRYKKNRDTVLAVLGELELTKDVGSVAPADGAFYVYVDLEKWGVGSTPSSKLTATELW